MTIADVLVLLGVALLTVGLALWSIAAALIVLGVMLLAAGLWSHQSKVGSRVAEKAPEAQTATADGGFE